MSKNPKVTSLKVALAGAFLIATGVAMAVAVTAEDKVNQSQVVCKSPIVNCKP